MDDSNCCSSSIISTLKKRFRHHHHFRRCLGKNASERMSFMSRILLLIATTYLSGVTLVEAQQQQSFRVKPEPVEVKLGGQAVLRCEVDNQAGRAQWTKDGFALGFQREIPGYPRYGMVGDASGGVHNLRISNVTLQDIAEYQCQVLPKGAIKAIRADARLDVLVPPRSIEMLNHAPDATITVKEKESFDLECIVRDARPAATIIWYKNDKILRTENREDVPELVDITADGVTVKMNTTRSKIKILPTSEDDRSKYTCEARHKAHTKPTKVSVSLSVQYPPGAPRIDGYTEGEPIRENKSVTLVCISRGGNPLAELIWYKNDVRIDSSYSTLGRESRNELTLTATTKDNLARLRCEASNIMISTPKIADVVLTVMFNPKEVKINGPTEAKPGENVTLTCITSNSNPKAEIAWFKGGESVDALYTYSPASPDGGWTTSSNVSIPVYDTDRSIIVTCQGVNKGLGESKVASHTINVIQPPGRPRIYKTSLNMTTGHSQQVTCTSTGGHPPATLQWFKGNKRVDSRMETKGNMVTAELSLVANPNDNGEVYRCEAKNKAVPKAYAESITFHVLFAPSFVNITVNPQVLKEGQRVNLTCESGSSNPAAKMTWWKDGVSIPHSFNYTLPGENRGKRSVSVLMLDLTSELDNALYTCSANNQAVKKSVHDGITLQVSYKPKFIENPGEKVTVVEGKSQTISVKAKGNPDHITYKWSKNGSRVVTTKGKVTVDGAEMSFIDVSRKDKGKYEIEATNKEGTTTLNIELDVQYPARVDTPFPWIMIGEGELANMECAIDANPLEESMVEWSHESPEKMSQLGERVERVFQDNKSYLTIKNVTASDAGLFHCQVNNGIGEATNRSIFLIVKHKPEVDLSPQIARAAANNKGTGSLICRANGAPNVTFSWSREGRAITNETEPAKYSVLYNQVDMMTWESILLVKDVTTRDYGGYECVARNELDDVRHTVRLDVTSVPETPTNLHVVNFTHDSVTLTWIPGFDGGYEQSYKVRYVKVGSDNARFVEVFPKNSTIFTVTQLRLGTEYAFSVAASNIVGESNYTGDNVRQETSKDGPNRYASNPDGEIHTNPFSRLVIGVFIVVGASMLLINVFLIACFLKRRSKKRMTSVYPHDSLQLSQMLEGKTDMLKVIIISASVIGTMLLLLNIAVVSYVIYKKKTNGKGKQEEASEQGSSKSATIEMYAPSSYNETVTGETLSSLSEKSATYSQHENHEEYIEDGGKGTGVSTYLVEPINHHSPVYPYQDMRVGGGIAGLRASTLPRQPKQHLHGSPLDLHSGHPMHHEDDGYVDALRRSGFNPGDKSLLYGRTTPRPTSRPPQVPPIPELYNIPPEARYVPCPPPGFGGSPIGNGSVVVPLSHSASHTMLNASGGQMITPTSFHQHQPNGHIITANGPLSPGRSSILTTFASNPSPNNMEHEGHLV